MAENKSYQVPKELIEQVAELLMRFFECSMLSADRIAEEIIDVVVTAVEKQGDQTSRTAPCNSPTPPVEKQ